MKASLSHRKTHSDGPKPVVKCHICDAEFSKKWNLDIHIQNKHSSVDQLPSNSYSEEDKLAAVAMADKVGMLKVAETLNIKVSALRNWKAMTKTEKSIGCRLCGKIFLYQSQLQKHMDCAHRYDNDKEKKPFKNRQCTPEFKREVADFAKETCYKFAAAHYKISEGTVRRWVAFYHNTIHCEDCGGVFAYEKELKKHQQLKHYEKYNSSETAHNSSQGNCYELEQRKEMLESLYAKKIQEELSDKKEAEVALRAELSSKFLEVVCEEESPKESKDLEEEDTNMIHENCHDDDFNIKEEHHIIIDEIKRELDYEAFHDFDTINNEVKSPDQDQEMRESQMIQKTSKVQSENLRKKTGTKMEPTSVRAKYSQLEKKYIIRNKIWTCEQCGKDFNKKSNYQVHLKHHSQIKDFSCMSCGKAFYAKRALIMHTEKNHPENMGQFESDVVEPCNICTETFNTKAKMWLHKIDCHGFDFPFRCTKCSEGFVRIDLKRGHKRICDGVVSNSNLPLKIKVKYLFVGKGNWPQLD